MGDLVASLISICRMTTVRITNHNRISWIHYRACIHDVKEQENRRKARGKVKELKVNLNSPTTSEGWRIKFDPSSFKTLIHAINAQQTQ